MGIDRAMGTEGDLTAHQRMPGDPALFTQRQPCCENGGVGGDIGSGMELGPCPLHQFGLASAVLGAVNILRGAIPGEVLQALVLPVPHQASRSNSSGSIS